MTRTTHAQREAIKRLWLRDTATRVENVTYTDAPATIYPYSHYRKKVQPTFGMGGAVVINIWNMWLCIESDGYTHS